MYSINFLGKTFLFSVLFLFVVSMCSAQWPVVHSLKITENTGGFTGNLDSGDDFGRGIDSIGDINGDGVVDIVVGAMLDDDGGTDNGAVYILFMNSDGTVASHQKISQTSGGFDTTLSQGGVFGSSVSSLGDFDNDGITDIAVGAEYDSDGGSWNGAVWLIFLNIDGTVKSTKKISALSGGFTGTLSGTPTFGSDIANLGDLNGDGYTDLAVGSRRDNDGGTRHGAVWILFMGPDGNVLSHQKISDTQGGFNATLDYEDMFGTSLTNIGDLDGDGVVDLAVSALQDDDGGTDKGALYILFLNSDGTVKQYQKISDTYGNFSGVIDSQEWFGCSVATLGDIDHDGVVDIVVGAPGEWYLSAGGSVYILLLNTDGTVKGYEKITEGLNGFSGTLNTGDGFGWGVASVGMINNYHTLLSGAWHDDDSGTDAGAFWLLSIKGQVASENEMIDSNFQIQFNNPVGSALNIKINEKENALFRLYSSSGKYITETFSKNGNAKFQMESLSDGLYILEITTPERIVRKKIIHIKQ